MIYPELDHVGIVVPNLEEAVAEFSETFGYEFPQLPAEGATLRTRQPDRDGAELLTIHVALSTQRPIIELIQHMPGTVWDIGSAGYTLHHIGIWCSSIAKDSKATAARCPFRMWGVADEQDPSPVMFSYQLMGKGMTFELLDDISQGDGARRINLSAVVMDR